MTQQPDPLRPGEVAFPIDPGSVGGNASLVFIGRVTSPWTERAECPKNVRDARERGGRGVVTVEPGYRAGLAGLAEHRWIVLLTWLDRARRDLALQMPRHASEPHGTFSLRSPVRPNPIGLHLVRITALDPEAGRIEVDAIDVLDGTPLIDVKPFFGTVDVPPGWTSASG